MAKNKEFTAFSTPQTIFPSSIGSSEFVSSTHIFQANYNNFSTQTYFPAYETGYFDVVAISREFAANPDLNLNFSNLDSNYLFSVENFSLNYRQTAEYDSRLAGEGANPSTFYISNSECSVSINIPLRVESWGYVDFVFAALYDFFIEGYKGSPSTVVGRFTTDNSSTIGIGTSVLYIDNIANFLSFSTPFTAKIKVDDSSLSETVTVTSYSKRDRSVTLSAGISTSFSRSTGYLWAYPTNSEREPSFSLYSLKQGLIAGCLVDKISLTFRPGESIIARVDIKALDIDRTFQTNMVSNFETILQAYSKRKPSFVLNGRNLRIYKSIPDYGFFGLGTLAENNFFGGYQQSELQNMFINEVTLELSNNLKPVHTLASKHNDRVQRKNKNNLPFAYYSEGRKISGSIKYTGPIKPWSIAEFLAGPSVVNNGGITLDMGPAKIELPEVVWSVENSTYEMTTTEMKTVNFSVVTQNYDFNPVLKSTGVY